MNLRSLLGLDLSAKLKKVKKRYKKQQHFFDSDNVICILNQIKKTRTFYWTACSYCDDPSIGGIDMSPIFWFYQSGKFPTENEAFAFLNKEIRRATKKHPNARFYREKQDPPKDQPVYEYCINGEWFDAGMLPSLKRCSECNLPLSDEETVCSNCGGLAKF